jgi:hypothetical protein
MFQPIPGIPDGTVLDSGSSIAGPSVPESSTWAMLLLGFAGLGYAGYRRRQKLAGAARV